MYNSEDLSMDDGLEKIKLAREMLANEGVSETKDPYLIAQAYAELYTKINLRLKRCQGLLNSGMRMDAFEEAEKDPPLLDFCEELRIIEKMGWRQLCTEKKMDIPDELNVDTLMEIKTAYENESLISSLLVELRAASNRGINKECVRLLRQIKEKDSRNSEWNDDLKEFEIAYAQDIRKEFKVLQVRKNTEEIKELYNELKKPWHIPLDTELLTEIKTYIQQQEQEQNEEKANELTQKINNAYEQKDFQGISTAIDAYRELEKNEFFKNTKSLEEVCGLALKWYRSESKKKEQQLFCEQKLRQIEKQIKDGNAAGVKNLLQELHISGCPVPEHLERMALDLVDATDAESNKLRKKRYLAIILTMLVSTLIICGIFLFFYLNNVKTSKLEKLEEAFQKEQYARVEIILNEMESSPAFFLSKTFIDKQKSRALRLADKLKLKKQTFDSVIEQLEKIVKNKVTNAPKIVKDLIAKAERNITNKADKARLSEIEAVWASLQNNEMKTIMNRIKKHLEATGPPSAPIYKEVKKRLPEMVEMKNTAMALNYISDAYQQEFAEIKDRINQLETMLGNRDKQVQKIHTADSLKKYLQELRVFISGSTQPGASIRSARAVVKNQKLYLDFVASPFTSDPDNLFWHKISGEQTNIKAHSEEIIKAFKSINQNKEYTDLWQCRYKEKGHDPIIYFFKGRPKKKMKTKSFPGKYGDFDQVAKASWYVFEGEAYAPQKKDTKVLFELKGLNEKNVDQNTIHKLSYCDVIKEITSDIENNPGVENILIQMRHLLNETSIDSPIFRYKFFTFFNDQVIKLLGTQNNTGVTHIAEILNEYKRYTDANGDIQWLCSKHWNYKNYSQRAQSVLDKIAKENLLNKALGEYRLLKVSAQRGVRWVGSVDVMDIGKLNLHNNTKPSELWVLRGDANHPQLIIAEKNGNFVQNWRQEKYLAGEPLFAPGDNRRTQPIATELIKNLNLPKDEKIPFPVSWPINL